MKKQLDIANDFHLIFLKLTDKWYVIEEPLIQWQPLISLLENFKYVILRSFETSISVNSQ